MTGRDIILYILENHLEDELFVQNGKPLGFLTVEEAAAKTNVGPATIQAWLFQQRLNYVLIGNGIYIPANFKSPIDHV